MGMPNAHNSIQPILPSWFFSIFMISSSKMFQTFRNANHRPAGKATFLSNSCARMSQYRDKSNIVSQNWDGIRILRPR